MMYANDSITVFSFCINDKCVIKDWKKKEERVRLRHVRGEKINIKKRSSDER